MAINKNFVVKNGLEVSTNLIIADSDTRRVGIATSQPGYLLDVAGGIGATDVYVRNNLYAVGVGTFATKLSVGTNGTTLTGVGGSVGLGTALPAYVLDIRSPVSTGQTALYVKGDVRVTGDLVIEDDLSLDEITARQGTITNLNSTGITTIGFITANSFIVSGISTLGVTSTTNLTSQQLNVSGISTLGVTSATNLTSQQLNVSGISTLGVTSTTNLTSQQLNVSGITTVGFITANSFIVSGISTLGVTSTTNLTSQQLNVSGISTLGITSVTNLTTQQLNVSGITTLGITSATNLTSQQLNVSGISTLGVTSTTNLTSQQLNVSGISTLGITSVTNLTTQQLNVSGISTLGVTSTTNLTSQQLNVSGISTLGITSATNLTSQQLNVSGVSTFTNGPVLIGSGTSTGTANQKLQVTGGAYVSGSVGIGTTNPTSTLTVTGNALISGIITASQFVGDGSDLRNLSGTHIVSYASHSETSNSTLSIAGISTYNQVGILTGSLAVDLFDSFGYSAATSADGKTIIVGAPGDEIGATTGTGVVYVYDRVGNSFNQVGILTGSLAVDAFDNFGRSVATSADGKTIIVGDMLDEIGANTSTGVVYVFDRQGNSFNQVGILTGSLAGDTSDNFGNSVATSADGKTIIVGAYQDEIGATTGTGVVYVFDRVGNSFNQVGILTGSLAGDPGDDFGNSVATSADGKTIVVGAPDDQIGATTGTGVVYVFDRVGNSFNQVGIFTGSLAVDAFDGFGYSVATSADGKTIIVGAYDDEIGANTSTGVVYVYDRVGNSFNQVGILTGSLAVNTNDIFGYSVATSADGKTIIVGAYQDEIGTNTSTGVAYVFNRQGNSFNQVGILTGSGAGDPSDNFGRSVATSADGKTIIVGAIGDESGTVYVFDQTRDTYVHSGPTGSIGIGTTNPTSKLHVIGDARVGINTSQGVILTSANGTSYRLIVSDAGVLSTILVT